MYAPGGRKVPQRVEAEEVPSEHEEPECKRHDDGRSKAVQKRDNSRALQALEGTVGMYNPVFADGIVISVPEEALESAVEADEDTRYALEILPGYYWKIGVDGDGISVFRQQPVSEDSGLTNNQQLYCYFARAGAWYIVDTLKQGEGQTSYAYLAELFGDVYVPYSAKKTCGVKSEPIHEYLENGLAGHEVQEAERLEAVRLRKEQNEQNQADKSSSGGGGGWFNRVEKINVCWEAKDWDGIEAILTESKSTLLWQQVMAKRHGKSKGKGKGGGSKGAGKSKGSGTSKGSGKGSRWT